jgi:hypothetical protein
VTIVFKNATPNARALSVQVYAVDNIWIAYHTAGVGWTVEIGDEFEPEFDNLDENVQTEILALSRLLQHFGPQLGRPALTP